MESDDRPEESMNLHEGLTDCLDDGIVLPPSPLARHSRIGHASRGGGCGMGRSEKKTRKEMEKRVHFLAPEIKTGFDLSSSAAACRRIMQIVAAAREGEREERGKSV